MNAQRTNSKTYCFRAALLAPIFLAITLHVSLAALSQTKPDTAASAGEGLGKYYALVIGNKNYTYLPQLDTPINDAKSIASVLTDRYGFETTVLYDATRADILTALVKYRRSLPRQSNLLIFYAGHGYRDHDSDEAYWLPVDAKRGDNVNWISAEDITANIRAIPALHVLIISDSCYSGGLSGTTRGIGDEPSSGERNTYLAKIARLKSRNLLASGGDEPVADGGGNGHSIFASILIESLNGIDSKVFNTADLFQNIQPRVGGRSRQLPQYGVILASGHDGGDFIFEQRGANLIIDPPEGQPVARASSAARPSPDSAFDSAEPNAQAVLDTYQHAYEAEDMKAMRRIWPAITPQESKGLQDLFDHARQIKLNCSLIDVSKLGPDTAAVRFSLEGSLNAGGRTQKLKQSKVVMTLKKNTAPDGTSDWVIDSIQ